MNKLEISVNTKEQAIIAEAGGADRLEISNQDLFGGITPKIEDISEVVIHTTLPCYIQLKPTVERWSLTDEEFKKVLHVIEIAKLAGVKGIVAGSITKGKIDKKRLDKLIDEKGNLELIFNHSIDSVYDFESEMKYLLNKNGVDKIITNGSARTIFDGIERLLQFKEKLNNKLIIGGSLSVENIDAILKFNFKGVVYQCTTSLNDSNGILSIDKIRKFKEKLM